MEKSLLLDIPSIKIGVFDKVDFEQKHDSFHSMYHNEPHAIRRKLILAKHPEIEKLSTKEPRTIYFVLAVNILQFATAYWVQNASWPVYLFVFYFVGATLSHMTQALVHDLTHFLGFESILQNRLAAIACNIPTGIPSAISFGRYHRDHHLYMHVPGVDPDLPTEFELKFFQTKFRKFFFVLLMPFFYAIRPYFICPKALDKFEILNYAVIFSTDYLIVRFLGWPFMLYILLASIVGMGLHPNSMHVIAEHYEFVQGQETYSYYGILNIPNLNLGYHVEHHDFPSIPWSKLPQVRKIAPEFYDNLPSHSSYVMVALRYIFNTNIGPWSRIIRKTEDEKYQDYMKVKERVD